MVIIMDRVNHILKMVEQLNSKESGNMVIITWEKSLMTKEIWSTKESGKTENFMGREKNMMMKGI